MAETRGKKRAKKNIPHGIAYIYTSFNNCIVTFTDPKGNAVSWSTCGTRGFKGSKKGTPFAAQTAAEDASRKAKDHGMRSVEVNVKGPGAGRESAVRGIVSTGIRVQSIQDITPVAHNGCRPPKKRRV